jgi:hypothetical protein
MMCDGELRAIQEVREGEWVLARDERTGEVSCREVVEPYDNPGRSIILVTLADSLGNEEVIETTDNHPFYVDGKGWTRVDHLNPGDFIPSADRGLLTVTALEWTPRVETVYNFGVDEFHTYFVGAIGAWVYNCFYNSAKAAPAWPKRFSRTLEGAKPGNTLRENIKNSDRYRWLQEQLPGEWKKVYRNGYDGGKEVSVHYFEHTKTHQVYDVKVYDGWSKR